MPERRGPTMRDVATSTAAPGRSVSLRAIVAWGLAAFALLASAASLTIWAGSLVDIVTVISMPLAFGGVGAYLTVRVPTNPIGPLLLIASLGFALLVGSGSFVVVSLSAPSPFPGTVLAGLLGNLMFVPALVIVLVGVTLLFPDGRFLSPRWRWVAIAAAVVVAASEVQSLFGVRELTEVSSLPNPFYREDLRAALDLLNDATSAAAVPIFAASIWCLVLRYRRADEIGRHQIRWLAAASTVSIGAFIVSFFAPPGIQEPAESFGVLALNAIPLAIGIAILRYRLYEIDRLISRGISYAIVSILLVAVYVASVLVLQGPLSGVVGEDTITVAVSTLVVASLFQPVRRRVQRIVDRRFDRARVDGERTIDAFSERLRDEVDIEMLMRDLGTTVDAAVRPTRQGLWLRDGGD